MGFRRSTKERRFQFVDPIFDCDNAFENEVLTITVSESWIRSMYYPFWIKKCIEANREDLVSNFEACVSDFITVNWAYEIK